MGKNSDAASQSGIANNNAGIKTGRTGRLANSRPGIPVGGDRSKVDAEVSAGDSAETGNRIYDTAAAAEQTESAQAQIGVETQDLNNKPPKQPRADKPVGNAAKTSEPPKKSHHKKKVEAAKLSAGEAGEAAVGLIEMVELFAVARFGPEAAFSVQERLFIEPSLARIIERYGSVAQQFSFLVDPIMLAVGVGLYGARIVGLAKDQPKSETKGEDYPPPSPTSLDNGDNGVLPTASSDIWERTGGKF